MPIKVGIPRALLFYEYFRLWISFFENLGAEVVVSEKTNKEIIDNGVKSTVDEACLPVKIFHGHVLNLKDKVDYIFIPRLTSVNKYEYICPKFCGLPEMIKYSLKDVQNIIDTNIDFRKSKKNLNKTIIEIGRYITRDVNEIKKAFKNALEQHNEYHSLMKKGLLPIDILENNYIEQLNEEVKVVLLGHPYNIYDSYSSMNIIKKLRGYKLSVITCDALNRNVINQNAETLDKKMFWSFGRKILGTALYAMEDNEVCGIIYLSSFGCGLDSVIADIVERRIRRSSNKPFTLLTIDEHTGEAGIDTRIEAFVDMIRWREKNENNLSTHRKFIYPN
ncbi:acyl-CoA dehydratase activase-related protein [Paramaledivibacter caminithermalis]|jgi:predicted nucleotide-binding protein (sugar kinase/HSP70/actin superfamily)|uniref:Predicted nucleotide-binding protein, sugar kinase/HSP70/actin superfamily n=1 Tax=Paramaledivibacter caminithermalis (strain DSM 15212 / CIP 107654 / DViRD3) TaxID=1121301 RepID=A0A1M6SIE1_PARC5|nr:acyl-CoA dehydratase activase-related protein [Paramaledivibacter caminithermalis]SHK44475.1 Predicted nucleotide-binding protein, sugar kinase/HSP70/actin superfamily [Paramaledivibacter caminithermalis DSM 15212]